MHPDQYLPGLDHRLGSLYQSECCVLLDGCIDFKGFQLFSLDGDLNSLRFAKKFCCLRLGATAIGVPSDEPLRCCPVGQSEFLVLLVVVSIGVLDHLLHAQHLAGNLGPCPWNCEWSEGEVNRGAISGHGTPSRHETNRNSSVERNIIPTTLHAIVGQEVRALDFLVGGIRGRTDEFLKQRSHHDALRHQASRRYRGGFWRGPDRLRHVPNPDALRNDFTLWPKIVKTGGCRRGLLGNG